MTNTPFSKQVEIVADYYSGFQGDAVYDELIATFDVGFPLAVAIANGGISEESLTDIGRAWITEAFLAILDFYGGIDPDGEYDSVDDIMAMVFINAKG